MRLKNLSLRCVCRALVGAGGTRRAGRGAAIRDLAWHVGPAAEQVVRKAV